MSKNVDQSSGLLPGIDGQCLPGVLFSFSNQQDLVAIFPKLVERRTFSDFGRLSTLFFLHSVFFLFLFFFLLVNVFIICTNSLPFLSVITLWRISPQIHLAKCCYCGFTSKYVLWGGVASLKPYQFWVRNCLFPMLDANGS